MHVEVFWCWRCKLLFTQALIMLIISGNDVVTVKVASGPAAVQSQSYTFTQWQVEMWCVSKDLVRKQCVWLSVASVAETDVVLLFHQCFVVFFLGYVECLWVVKKTQPLKKGHIITHGRYWLLELSKSAPHLYKSTVEKLKTMPENSTRAMLRLYILYIQHSAANTSETAFSEIFPNFFGL